MHHQANRLRMSQRLRRGSAVFETILVLPVLIAGLFAIVEFSMLANRQQHLVEASRNGALVASRLDPSVLKSTRQGEAPADVRQAVLGRLSEVDIGNADIRFTYDAAARADVAARQRELRCRGNTDALGVCVRVEVTVPATELSPNLLSVFGFDISKRDYSAASVYPYER